MGPLLKRQHPEWEVFTTGTYQHPTIPYLHANPDGLTQVDGEWVIVEAKTSRNYWDEVPPSYLAQVQFYMMVMGVKRAVIVGLIAMDWVEYWVEADEFEQDVMKQAAERFWLGVKNDTAPAWDGSESTTRRSENCTQTLTKPRWRLTDCITYQPRKQRLTKRSLS